jgi:hypothetical protein
MTVYLSHPSTSLPGLGSPIFLTIVEMQLSYSQHMQILSLETDMLPGSSPATALVLRATPADPPSFQLQSLDPRPQTDHCHTIPFSDCLALRMQLLRILDAL